MQEWQALCRSIPGPRLPPVATAEERAEATRWESIQAALAGRGERVRSPGGMKCARCGNRDRRGDLLVMVEVLGGTVRLCLPCGTSVRR